jgi:hypothetical protein
MNDQAIAKFGRSLRGALIGRRHPEYEEARKLYKALSHLAFFTVHY